MHRTLKARLSKLEKQSAPSLTPQVVSPPFFSLDMPGTPVPKGRPRMTKSGRVYTPSATRAYEDAIRLQTLVLMSPRHPTKEPCIVHAGFFFAFPKGWNRQKREGEQHSVRPDLDNVLKSALDGICGERGAIRDDKQIIEIHAFKCYADESSFELDVWEITADIERLSHRWRAWKSGLPL
jgi:Holliday junction resolvase RusA-like endonuclease